MISETKVKVEQSFMRFFCLFSPCYDLLLFTVSRAQNRRNRTVQTTRRYMYAKLLYSTGVLASVRIAALTD